jgi:hypothetical protein
MTNGESPAVVTSETDVTPELLEKLVIGGDLSELTTPQRLEYYAALCRSLHLNPLSRPFQYLNLNGKLVLYATRDCGDQIRYQKHMSVRIVSREQIGEVYVVTAQGTLPDGRSDESTGAVFVGKVSGDALANLLMKAETKAKRRVTLALAGLGFLDESEVEGIPRIIQPATRPLTSAPPPPAPTSAPAEAIAEALLDDAAEGLTREAQEARDFLLQQISEAVTTAFPGNTVEAKRGRTGLLLEAFHVTARSQLLGLPLEALRTGYATLQTLVPGSGGAEARGSGGAGGAEETRSGGDEDAPAPPRPSPSAPVPTGAVMQQWYRLSKRAMAAGLSAAQYDALRAQDDYAAALAAVDAAAEGQGRGGEAADG